MCPIAGCTARIRVERDIVIDEQLADALAQVPADICTVNVRRTAAGGPYELSHTSAPTAAISLEDTSTSNKRKEVDDAAASCLKKMKPEAIEACPALLVEEVDGL